MIGDLIRMKFLQRSVFISTILSKMIIWNIIKERFLKNDAVPSLYLSNQDHETRSESDSSSNLLCYSLFDFFELVLLVLI